MAYIKPTLNDLVNRIENDMLSRVTQGTGILRRAVLRVIAKVIGAAIYLTYGFVEFWSAQLFVTTSETLALEEHARTWGKTRKASTPSSGTITVTGAESTIVAAGTSWQSAGGVQYVTQEEKTISGGSIDIVVLATTDGANGNLKHGEILSIMTPIAGVDDTATVAAGGLSSGTDTESDDSLRSRILARIQNGPEVGRAVDYEAWVREVVGVAVTRVWVFPGYLGPLSIGVFFVNDDAEDIFPSSADVLAVQTHLEDKAPIGATPSVFAAIAREIGITITTSPNDPQVADNIKNSLLDMFATETKVGTQLYVSQIQTAIGRAVGEVFSTITGLTTNGVSWDANTNVPVANNELPVLTSLIINGTEVM